MTKLWMPSFSSSAQFSNSAGNFPMPYISTFYVVILSIITLSLYLPYWLYTRTKIVDELTPEPIHKGFIFCTIVLYVGSTLLSLMPWQDQTILAYWVAVQLASIIGSIMLLVWVFKIKNKLLEALGDQVSAKDEVGYDADDKSNHDKKMLEFNNILLLFFRSFISSIKLISILIPSRAVLN